MNRNVSKTIAAAVLLLAANVSAVAQGPSWIRRNSISPDGSTIAFSYMGDIWTVPAAGGRATQITSNQAFDSEPFWTRDGKSIVFASYRELSKDIFITSTEGGLPLRLTDLPGNETPMAVLEDGTILFSSYNSDVLSENYDGFPGSAQLFRTDVKGSAPKLVTSLPVMALSVAKNGTVLYEDYKGYEDALRKHHTSSVTRDIWKFVPAVKGDVTIDSKGSFTRLSDYKGEDRNPVFASDGDTFYYLSERDGKTSNVYRSSLSNPSSVKQLTFETKNPVRFLSVSDNGTLAYSLNGDLYTLKEGGKPQKVDIRLVRDENERQMLKYSFSSGAESIAVSPDGKEVAFVSRGDVFVTSTEFRTTRRITNTACQERDVDFSEDGRELYYSSERNGHWGIYKSSLVRKEDKLFTYAVQIKEELVSKPGETCFQPDVSPDGKWVAFYRDRTELMVQNIRNGEQKSLFKGINYSYSDGDQGFEWSPDSHYILCNWQENGGWNNQDVAVVDIDSGEITNLTRSGYSDGNFKWALGGKAMTWESDKMGYRSHGSWGAESDIFIMFFDGKAMNEFARSKEELEIEKLFRSEKEEKAEKKEEKKDSLDKEKNRMKKLELDLASREFRIKRLTPAANNMGDHFLSPDGNKLYFTQRLEKSYDLCVRDLQEGNVSVLAKGVSGSFHPSADGSTIYLSSGSGIKKLTLASGETESIAFSGEFEYKAAEERAYMFEHIWKQVKEKFYVEDLHGTDWDYYHDNYAAFLPHINNNFDFQDMLSEMLGELNGSHTGARYRPAAQRNLGYLGVIYDLDWKGDGLKIREILPGGVLDLADSGIKAGDVIESVEGVKLSADSNWQAALTDKAGKRVSLVVRKDGGRKAEEIFVVPASSDSEALYRRWVRQREDMVEKLSGGRVGYVHIEGMDSPSFREMFSKALGKYRNCDALIVDTRHNGGGWLHDDVVTFLSGKLYNQYIPRGQFIGNEPFTKWTKPSCMLVGEDNYSDASGTPYAYRMLGIGKLIGAPIPGTMTAVWWENQIDNTIVFGIPQVGTWSTSEKHFIENHQIEPDIEVYNDPASVLRGEDKQLEAAVAEMLKQIR